MFRKFAKAIPLHAAHLIWVSRPNIKPLTKNTLHLQGKVMSDDHEFTQAEHIPSLSIMAGMCVVRDKSATRTFLEWCVLTIVRANTTKSKTRIHSQGMARTAKDYVMSRHMELGRFIVTNATTRCGISASAPGNKKVCVLVLRMSHIAFSH